MPDAPTTAVDAQRDPLTAAAVIVLLGMLDALERGDAIATTCNATDGDGKWSLTVELAEVSTRTATASAAPAATTCPNCKQIALVVGRCRHCDFVDD